MPFSSNHQETLKRYRFITYKTWKLHSTPETTQGGHREEKVKGRGGGLERERRRRRGRDQAWGSVFIGVKGEGLGYVSLLFFGEFET